MTGGLIFGGIAIAIAVGLVFVTWKGAHRLCDWLEERM